MVVARDVSGDVDPRVDRSELRVGEDAAVDSEAELDSDLRVRNGADADDREVGLDWLALVEADRLQAAGALEAHDGAAEVHPHAVVAVDRFEDAANKFAELHGVPTGEMMSSQAVWKDLTHAMFNLKEFIYIP
jgi:hypothetical protein